MVVFVSLSNGDSSGSQCFENFMLNQHELHEFFSHSGI